MKIQPLGDRILVKEIETNEKAKKTASGIILPESAANKDAKQGKVIAVGRGSFVDGKLIPPEMKVGDTVLFQWGDKVMMNNEEHYIVTGSSILAVIK